MAEQEHGMEIPWQDERGPEDKIPRSKGTWRSVCADSGA